MVSLKIIVVGAVAVLATVTNANSDNSSINANSNSANSTNVINTATVTTTSNFPDDMELHPDYIGTSFWDKGVSALFAPAPKPGNAISENLYGLPYPYRGYCEKDKKCRVFQFEFKCPTCTNPKLWRGCCLIRRKDDAGAAASAETT